MTNRTEPHITTPDELMSIIKNTRKLLDHLEACTYYGQQWVGYPEQKELGRIAARLDSVCAEESTIEPMLDKWENAAYLERRENEGIAFACKMHGVAYNINRRRGE